MTEALKVVEFPGGDIPSMLRAMADAVEAGAYGDAHNFAWVCDCGCGHIELGLMGPAPSAAPLAHFLFGSAMQRLQAAPGSIG